MMADCNTKQARLWIFGLVSSQTDKDRLNRMLNTIDTVIAFAVIMTVLSLPITIVVQMVSVAFLLRETEKDSMGEMSLPARQHGTIEQRRDPVGDPH
jgi:hypothetical protein